MRRIMRVNTHILMAAYVVAFHPARVFGDQLLHIHAPLMEAVMHLLISCISPSLTESFNSILFRYFAYFELWKNPDQNLCLSELQCDLFDLYGGFEVARRLAVAFAVAVPAEEGRCEVEVTGKLASASVEEGRSRSAACGEVEVARRIADAFAVAFAVAVAIAAPTEEGRGEVEVTGRLASASGEEGDSVEASRVARQLACGEVEASRVALQLASSAGRR